MIWDEKTSPIIPNHPSFFAFSRNHQHGSILPALDWQEAAQDLQFLLPGLTSMVRTSS